MQGRIVILDAAEGTLGPLAAKLKDAGFDVNLVHTNEELLPTVKQNESQLLIAFGSMGSGSTLADQLYDTVNIPIMLVLSTAGEDTMTFLRRHPGVIGVYYTPINLDKFLERVHRFFRV
ncbi:MAG TPA: hypothetical protein VLR94_08580 [Acidobacteriota bacterium]|nr:hypothetical protein [Acidobacteriota bacterium]